MNRIDYWKAQAQEAKADFDRLVHEQDKADESLTSLMRWIECNREVDRLTHGADEAWLYQ